MKVLLVEDDPGIGRVVCNGLQAVSVSVDWLRLGEPAIRQAQAEAYDAIVLDLSLPDTDGLVLCRRLRELGCDVPICVLTARDSLEDKLEGFAAGADDYVTKPFAVSELLARLTAIRRRAGRGHDEALLKVGALSLDLRARTATLRGCDLELTRREFDVLAFLARNAGLVVTRERLLQVAFSDNFEITANTADVYIGYIRRKLRAVGDKPEIVTVRGVGYRLSV